MTKWLDIQPTFREVVMRDKRKHKKFDMNESIKGTSIPLCSNFVTWSDHRELTCYSALYHTKTILSMSCQYHNLSVFIWFWYATTKNNWSFQTILTRRQYCLLGGMLVALSEESILMVWMGVKYFSAIVLLRRNLPIRCIETTPRAFVSWIANMALYIPYGHRY